MFSVKGSLLSVLSVLSVHTTGPTADYEEGYQEADPNDPEDNFDEDREGVQLLVKRTVAKLAIKCVAYRALTTAG